MKCFAIIAAFVFAAAVSASSCDGVDDNFFCTPGMHSRKRSVGLTNKAREWLNPEAAAVAARDIEAAEIVAREVEEIEAEIKIV